ncbi:MAG: MarR family transcriptional regulator, partial [Mesorhizobium sp.]
VVLTDDGREAYDAAMRLQAPWINTLADGLAVEDINTMHGVITALRKKLEGNDDAEEQG